jgi:cell division initiation protein
MAKNRPTVSPSELRSHEFERRVRGYDPSEVHDILELAADSLEQAILQIDSLSRDARRLEEQVNKFETMESTIKDTLVSTHGSVEEIRRSAEKEAELIKREAQIEAATELEMNRRKVEELKVQAEKLRSIRNEYLARMKALVASHQGMLATTEKEFEPSQELPDEEIAESDDVAHYDI